MTSVENNPQQLIRKNMPELDFVRGIAILMVFLVHGFFGSVAGTGILSKIHGKIHGIGRILILSTQSSWLGVQLFFVLSGFLITGILLESRERQDYYKRFYWRRALRILPAYFAVLLILWLLGMVQWPFLLTCILFVSNLSTIFSVPLQYALLWTLAVEEQFYLLWPMVVRRLSIKSLTVLATLIVILVPIIRLITFIESPKTDLYYYTWFVADGLAVGALLSIFLRSKKTTRKKALIAGSAMALIGAGAIIIGAHFGMSHRKNLLGAMFQLSPWHILFAGFITLTLILGTSKWKKIVNFAWLRYLGRISYGLYLIHMVIFIKFDEIMHYFSPALSFTLNATFSGLVLRFFIAGGISVIIAALSRKYFEEFFLKMRDIVLQKNYFKPE